MNMTPIFSRKLTALIFIALLLLGAGLPAKAQFVVTDPTVIASDLTNLAKDLAQAKAQYDQFVKVYNSVSDIVSGFRAAKKAGDALTDICKLPDAVLRNQRNNKYLYDHEKLRCYDITMAIMIEAMETVSEIKKISRTSDPDSKTKLSQGERLVIIKDLSNEVIDLRNRAYRIVNKYDKISDHRAKKANTQRLFDQLNGYK